MKTLLIACIFFTALFPSVEIANSKEIGKNEIEMLKELTGALFHAKIDDYEDFLQRVARGETIIEVTDRNNNGRKYGYFSVRVSVMKYLNVPQGRANNGLSKFEILIPAVKIGDRWSLMYPKINGSDVFIVADTMELGFKQFVCLKYVQPYSIELEKKLSKSK